MQNEIVELRIGKDYFDIIIGSQMNVFTTIIAIITLLLTIVNFKAIFRDLPNLAKAQYDTEKDIQQFKHDLNETRFNSNRAFYLGHLNRENYDWATLIALRCVELSTKKKDIKGVLSWVESASKAYEETDDNQKKSFKERFLKEANRRLDLASEMEDAEDPNYIKQISDLKKKLNS